MKPDDGLLDIGAVIDSAIAPASVRKAQAILDKIPPGKVLDRKRLSERVGLDMHTYCTHPALEPYRIRLKRRVYFGSKETIAKAKGVPAKHAK